MTWPSFRARTDTGTIASSGSAGSSSRPISHERSAELANATTTSLTVVASVVLIRFTASSGRESKAYLR